MKPMTPIVEQWIPVAKELPDDDQTVLIATEDGEVWMGYHDDRLWFHSFGENVSPPVTHWMPLPEPPGAA